MEIGERELEVGCTYDFDRMVSSKPPWHLRKVLEGV